MTRTFRRLLALAFLLPILAASPARAQLYNAGDPCPEPTAGRLFTQEGAAGPSLVCNGTTLEVDESVKTGPYARGVGTANPKAPLHVAGEAIIGPTTGLACDADRKGGLRWSDANSTIEMCDGTDWKKVAASVCDNAPAFPSFTTQNDLATSSLTTSNIVLITGMDAGCMATVGVSGTGGSPEYRTCSDAACSSEVQTWTAANNALDIQGDYLQLRATSSASQATAFVITANIGPVSSTWTISTGVTGCAPEGTVCADGTVYAGLSGAATPMYVTRCDAGMTWDGSACTGTRGTYYWNNGNGTGYVDTSLSNSGYSDGQGYTAVLITEDSDSVTGGVQPHQAAQYCADLVMHGYDDWYLPAKNELNTMYGNKTAIGNFNTGGTYYWSSSEGSSLIAWSQRFSDGNQTSTHKYIGNAIRCARR